MSAVWNAIEAWRPDPASPLGQWESQTLMRSGDHFFVRHRLSLPDGRLANLDLYARHESGLPFGVALAVEREPGGDLDHATFATSHLNSAATLAEGVVLRTSLVAA